MVTNDSTTPERPVSPASARPAVRSFEVSPDFAALAPLRRSLATELPAVIQPAERDLLLVAVTEAVTNAIEAHQRHRVAEPVVVTVDPTQRTVTVDDCGGGIDPGAFVPVAPPRSAARGRGLTIMRGICPDMSVERTPTGTRIVLPFPS